MTVDVETQGRVFERITVPASAADLQRAFRDAGRFRELLPSTLGRLRSNHFAQRERQAARSPASDEPRVEVVDAGDDRVEWLVRVLDEVVYYGTARMRNIAGGTRAELEISLAFEPIRQRLESFLERLRRRDVRSCLRRDLTELRSRLSA
jgi:hypothetical protein